MGTTLLELLADDYKPPKRKSYAGRKKGTGIKTERLELRCSPETRRKLAWINEHSNILKGKSTADIIEHLLDDHVLMQQVCDYTLPRFK